MSAASSSSSASRNEETTEGKWSFAEEVPDFPSDYLDNEAAEDFFRCPVSLSIMEDPVLLGCGHHIDQVGLVHKTTRGRLEPLKKCPKCNVEINHDKNLPNRAMKQHIREKCSSWCLKKEEGCSAYMVIDRFHGHLLDECMHIRFRCANVDAQGNECEYVTTRAHRASHAKNDCPHRKVACSHCHVQVLAKELEGHEEACDERQVECRCGQYYAQGRQLEHRIHCSDEMTPCPICTTLLRRGALLDHCQEPDNIPTHLPKAVKRLTASKERESKDLVDEMKKVTRNQQVLRVGKATLLIAIEKFVGAEAWRKITTSVEGSMSTAKALVGLLHAIVDQHEEGDANDHGLVTETLKAMHRIMKKEEEREEEEEGSAATSFAEAGGCEVLVRVMAAFPGHEKVQEWGCWVTSKLVAHVDGGDLINSGLGKSIVAALQRWPQSSSIQRSGCNIMSEIASEDEARAEALGECGACEAVVCTLRAFTTDCVVVSKVLLAIAKLAGWDEVSRNGARFAEAGACQLVAAAMKEFPNDCRVQSHGLEAVKYLALDDDCKKMLGEHGACQLLVNAMRKDKFKTSQSIQCNGCWAVVNLAWDCVSNQEKLGKAGACKYVVRAMKIFPSDMEIQWSGAWAIKNLDAVNRRRLAEVGACSSVVKSMQRFPSESDIQKHGCCAIAMLADGGSESRAAELAKNGAVMATVTAMKSLPDDEDVQAEGCLALYQFSSNGYSSKVLRRGGCASMVAALVAFPENRRIAYNGLLAWKKIIQKANSSVNPRGIYLAAGGGEALVGVLEAFGEDREVAEVACWLVNDLASNHDDNKLADHGVCEALVEVMSNAVDKAHGDLLEIGCKAVGSLAHDHPDSKAKLGASGACEMVVNALRHFSTQVGIQSQALLAVTRLATDSEDNQAKLEQEGVYDLILVALQEHIKDQTVVKHAYMAIKSIARAVKVSLGPGQCRCVIKAFSSTRNRTVVMSGLEALIELLESGEPPAPFGKVGACKDIVSVLQTWFRDAEVVAQACTAIRLLVEDNDDGVVNDHKDKLEAAGVFKGLVDAMQHSPQAKQVQLEALSAITPLVSDDNKGRMYLAGLCTTTVRALRKFPTDKQIQESGLIAVQYLADGSSDNCTAVMGGGMCNHLVRIFEEFSEDHEVLARACQILTTLVRDTDTLEHSQKVGEAGLCQLLVDALKEHPDERDLQFDGCRAIAQLTDNVEENRTRLGEAGACEVVAATLRAFPTDCKLTEPCCEAIINLAADHADNIKKMEAAGVCELLVGAMGRFIEDSAVCTNALWAMVNLCTTQQAQIKLVEADACKLVVQALKSFAHDAAVADWACSVIALLAKDMDDHKLLLLQEGVPRALAGSMRHHVGDEDVMKSGLMAIAYLCDDQRHLRRKLGEAGVGDLVLKALHDYPDHGEIQKYGCLSVVHLCRDDEENRGLMVGAKAQQLLLAANQKFPEDEDIDRAAQMVDEVLGGERPRKQRRRYDD